MKTKIGTLYADLETGEGEVRLDKTWETLYEMLKLDLSMDWSNDLNEIYANTREEWVEVLRANMTVANNQYVQERMSQSAEGFAEAERKGQ